MNWFFKLQIMAIFLIIIGSVAIKISRAEDVEKSHYKVINCEKIQMMYEYDKYGNTKRQVLRCIAPGTKEYQEGFIDEYPKEKGQQ